ncbi:MAG TPA: hypothetical protein VK540_08390 [Polyangiaceae bacterium]|jgi:hypothetical protein|nr:hypothetical protein [Polyangiaceae bacterium]
MLMLGLHRRAACVVLLWSAVTGGPGSRLSPPWLYAIGGHGNTGDLNTVERASVH